MNPGVALERGQIYGIVKDRHQVMAEHWGGRDSPQGCLVLNKSNAFLGLR